MKQLINPIGQEIKYPLGFTLKRHDRANIPYRGILL